MTNEEKKEAAELAGRAKRQGRNAARNGIKAVEAAAEPVIDSVAEEIHDTAEKAQSTAEDAVNAAKMRLRGKIAPDVGMLALELTLSLYMSGRAYLRYRKVQGFRKGYAQGLKDWTETVPIEVVD